MFIGKSVGRFVEVLLGTIYCFLGFMIESVMKGHGEKAPSTLLGL